MATKRVPKVWPTCGDQTCNICYKSVEDSPRPTAAKDGARDLSVWRTADGRDIPIVEMSDNHLANTIGYLERKIGISDRTAWLPALREERERRRRLGIERRERELSAPPMWLSDPVAKGEKPSRAEQRAAMRAALTAPRMRRGLADVEEQARRIMEAQNMAMMRGAKPASPSVLDGLKPPTFSLDDYVFATRGPLVPAQAPPIGRELATPVIDDPVEFKVRTFVEPTTGETVAESDNGRIRVRLTSTSGPERVELKRVPEPEPARALTIESVMPSKGIPVDDIMDVLRENLVQHEQKKVQRG